MQSMIEKITNMLCCEINTGEGRPMVSSLDVALHFGKRHDNVLRDIDVIGAPEDFSRLNFEESTYINERGKEHRMFNITRDGFTLLAMGFTGKKAMEWKIAYINAFNRMEQELRGNTPVQQSPEKRGALGWGRKKGADAVIEFDGVQIRVVQDGIAYRFVAVDCCEALGYTRSGVALMKLDARFKRLDRLVDTMGRRKTMNTLCLQGALTLAENCSLPPAERFHGFMQRDAINQARLAIQ